MAALLERTDGYYAQFYDESRNPKRKRFSLKTTRKRTARKLLTRFEEDHLQGEFDPWNDDPWSYDNDDFQSVSIGKARITYLDRKNADGRTENTIRTYREVIGLLVDQTGESKQLIDLTATELRTFVRESSLAQATQRKRYNQLRTFFRWCVDEQYLKESPLEDVEAPEEPNKLPKTITEEELQALCDEIRKRYKEGRQSGGVGEGQLIWRIPLFWFAFYTGMRGSELGRLRWEHVDREKDLIYIRKQKNRREQTIPLNSRAKEVLDEVRDGSPEDFVFRSPNFEETQRDPQWFCGNVSRAFRRARKDADLRQGLSLHSLRHGFCTALAEAGKSAVVIKEAARHADISTSMRYVHMANEQLKDDVEDAF